jgi:trehalose/maltose transport system permease protein
MLPNDCYEAARLDGVSPLRLFFRVTLPLIRPALLVAVLFRLLDALRMFDLVYVLVGSSESAMTMSVYARRRLIEYQEVGFGSAASTLLFVVACAVVAVYFLARRRALREEYWR